MSESRWPIRTGGQHSLEDDSDPLQSELPVFGASFALSCSPRLEIGYFSFKATEFRARVRLDDRQIESDVRGSGLAEKRNRLGKRVGG